MQFRADLLQHAFIDVKLSNQDAPFSTGEPRMHRGRGATKLSHKPNVRRHENGIISTCLEGLG